MQIRSQRICAGIQATWTYLRLPSLALDTRFPAGMTGYLNTCESQPVGNYLIFYFPLENGIDIIRVLHGSRDMERLF